MSAFEHYSRQKKKPIKFKIKKPKATGVNGLQSSTPLAQPTLFTPAPDGERLSDNIFLSPIPKSKKKNKSKKRRKEKGGFEMSNIDEIDGGVRIDEEMSNDQDESLGWNGVSTFIRKKKTKGRLLPKERVIDDSSCEEVMTETAGEGQDSALLFREKPKRRRLRSEEGSPDPKIAKLLDTDSVEEGKRMLAWIISPVTLEDFFENYWEKKPLHIARNCTDYFHGICSKKDMERAFRDHEVYFKANVTITSYENGVRKDDTTVGRVRPCIAERMFRAGNSVRMLNPQTFIPNVATICSTLQELFRTKIGANTYLTPAGSQGFAPHYDDIEAFILQTEGQKEWKVYAPRSEVEMLPRLPSCDFNQSEIGEPVLEVTLKAGDLLYFPRGFIHQARCVEPYHSLHVTVSTYQLNSWGQFLKMAISEAIDNAIENEVELREGLPLDFLDQVGIVARNTGAPERENMLTRAKQLLSKVIDHVDVDHAADLWGRNFVRSSFPPPQQELTGREWTHLFQKPYGASVKLLSYNACRVTEAGDRDLDLHYNTDNRVSPGDEEELHFLITEEDFKVFTRLKEAYPRFCKVKDLMADPELSRRAVRNFLEELGLLGLLLVKTPKKIV